MKTRVLFVDDEPLVLQGLQRMLRPLRAEWDMEFVESGPKALERVAQAPFDVVVSDMRMPGMNGAQLLNEVMKRHPSTIRLILSGHADQDLIMKCVGSTHQYLAKPCEPEALRATIANASSLGSSLRNETLRKLVSQMDRLPSIPSLYTQVLEKLQQPEVPLDEVGEVIAKDIGMTAKILKLVNSAFFGLRRQISNPAEAVTYLGMETIKALVLSINAFSQYEHVKLGNVSLESIWNHSLVVAAAARAVAHAQGTEAKLAEEAFVAGMLHDTGKLVLASNCASRYDEAVKLAHDKQIALGEAEQQVFGANHADVGGYLLGLWGLPVPVVEAIALHHRPDQSLSKTFHSVNRRSRRQCAHSRAVLRFGGRAALSHRPGLPGPTRPARPIGRVAAGGAAKPTTGNDPMSLRILCVDDDANILAAYQRNLRKQFTIDTALGGEQALAQMDLHGPYAVVVADMSMPNMNGVQRGPENGHGRRQPGPRLPFPHQALPAGGTGADLGSRPSAVPPHHRRTRRAGEDLARRHQSAHRRALGHGPQIVRPGPAVAR
jgi:HD-like signal output (HDOD) protein